MNFCFFYLLISAKNKRSKHNTFIFCISLYFCIFILFVFQYGSFLLVIFLLEAVAGVLAYMYNGVVSTLFQQRDVIIHFITFWYKFLDRLRLLLKVSSQIFVRCLLMISFPTSTKLLYFK